MHHILPRPFPALILLLFLRVISSAQAQPPVEPPTQTPDNQRQQKTYNDLAHQEPDNAAWYMLRGLTKRQAGNPGGAIVDYTRAIRLEPLNVRAWAGRGKAWTDFKVLDSAMVDLNHALQLDPTYFQAYIDRGIVKTLLDDKKGGLADFDQAVALAPVTADAYLNRSTALYWLNQYAASLRDINVHLQHHPADALGFYNRARTYLALERYRPALQDMQRAQQLNPKDLDAFIGEADVYGDSGQIQKALGYLKTLLGRGFDEGRIWLEHGNRNAQLHKDEQACADWQRASQLDNSTAAENLQQRCGSYLPRKM